MEGKSSSNKVECCHGWHMGCYDVRLRRYISPGKCLVHITDWGLVWCSSFLLELFQACCPEMHTRFRLFMINITNFLVALILACKCKYICNAEVSTLFQVFFCVFLCFYSSLRLNVFALRSRVFKQGSLQVLHFSFTFHYYFN